MEKSVDEIWLKDVAPNPKGTEDSKRYYT